jgi:hypothetical protein
MVKTKNTILFSWPNQVFLVTKGLSGNEKYLLVSSEAGFLLVSLLPPQLRPYSLPCLSHSLPVHSYQPSSKPNSSFPLSIK